MFKKEELRKDLITKRCIDNNMTMNEACKEIGISKATLSRLEKSKIPDIETLDKICKWLGVNHNKYFLITDNHFENTIVDKESDIDVIGNCANCGVEYHIHKPQLKGKKLIAVRVPYLVKFVDPDKSYPVSYIINSDGKRIDKPSDIMGYDLTENQIVELFERELL